MTRHPCRKMIGFVVVIGALLSLAGCSKMLNTDKLEPQIQKTMARAGASVKSVDCPSNVNAKKGDEFECTVTTKDGSKGKLKVTQTDDSGHVVFRPTAVRFSK